MEFKDFVNEIIKKHNIKTSFEDVMKAISIEYEEQAKENMTNGVGVIGLDDATLEAIIIEAPAVIERAEKEKKKTQAVVKTATKKTSKPKEEKKGNDLVDGDEDTIKELEQLGLFD